MAFSDDGGQGPFAQRLWEWKEVGGGRTRTGEVIGKPLELAEAELLLGLCKQFSALPSQIEQEDVSIVRMLKIVEMGSREAEGGEEIAE